MCQARIGNFGPTIFQFGFLRVGIDSHNEIYSQFSQFKQTKTGNMFTKVPQSGPGIRSADSDQLLNIKVRKQYNSCPLLMSCSGVVAIAIIRLLTISLSIIATVSDQAPRHA